MKADHHAPPLRFPGFKYEWQLVSLSSIGGKGEYGVGARAKTYDNFNKYLRITDIDESTNKFIKKNITSPAGIIDDRYLLGLNDLVIARTGASTGKTYLYDPSDEKVFFAGYLIRFHITNADPIFVHLQMQRPHFQKWIGIMSVRSGQPGINAYEYGKYEFYTPSLTEQQKIADFVSVIDEKIALQQEKVDLLKKYKKGVAQLIFAQKLRFKDESSITYPCWQEKAFNKVYGLLKTNSLSRDNLETLSGRGVKNIHYGDIHTKLSQSLDVTRINLPTIRDTNLRFSENDFCQKGDLVIADASENYADIGKSIEITNLGDNQVVAGLHTFLARPNLDLIAYGYGGYAFGSAKVHMQITRLATGVSVLGVSKANLLKVIIPLPTKEEQYKIAELLNLLDQRIKLEKNKLKQLENIKKGLLQQVFL